MSFKKDVLGGLERTWLHEDRAFMGKDWGFEDGVMLARKMVAPPTDPPRWTEQGAAGPSSRLPRKVCAATLMLELPTGKSTSSPGRGTDKKMVDERQAFSPALDCRSPEIFGRPLTGGSSSIHENEHRWVSVVKSQGSRRCSRKKLTRALADMSDPLEKEATNCRAVEEYEDRC